MGFVDQTIFEDGKGNCLAACVASILKLPLSEVPNFAECGYMDGMEEWLNLRDMRAIQVRFADPEHLAMAYFPFFPNDLVIIWGKSPRSTEEKRLQHAVVGRPDGYGCEVVHDPHPSRAGILGHPHGVAWLVPVKK